MDWTEWLTGSATVDGRRLAFSVERSNGALTRIRHELSTNLIRVRFCPHLQNKLSEAVLKHLPDTVNPESDPYWGYHRQFEQTPGAIKVVEKEGSGDFTYTTEFWADGVRPKGLRVLANIFSKVFQELGESPFPVGDMLK